MKVTIRQKKGMHYLYADIVVSSLRCKCTTGISVRGAVFDSKTETVKGNSEAETNILINKIKISIMELVRDLQIRGQLTSRNISEGVRLIRENKTKPIISKEKDMRFINYINKHIEGNIGIKKQATIIQYKYCLSVIKGYEQRKKSKLTFDNIDLDFYNDFLKYCTTELKLSTNSIGKLIKNIKMWMGVAYEQKMHTNTQYASKLFKKPTEETDAVYLSEEEILKIRYTLMPNRHLENVRDIFVLACYTGVRSQDYPKLNYKNLNGDKMLKIWTEKTQEEVVIPLHPIAMGILEKYNGELNIISSQKFNQYLKDVCKLAGLKEKVSLSKTIAGKRVTNTLPKYMLISSHTARRSFATNAYKAGMSSIAIMAITGHKSEKVFLNYIKVTKEEHAKLTSQHLFFKDMKKK